MNNNFHPYDDLYKITSKYMSVGDLPAITNVIFNNPATIVYWEDGARTIVKTNKEDCENFDKEKGLAMAISKKAFGNKGNYYNNFKKWIDI